MQIQTDLNGLETSIEIYKRRGNGQFTVLVYSKYGFTDQTGYSLSKCLRRDKCYKAVVRDTGGDGICCNSGSGGFQGYWNGKYLFFVYFALTLI